MPNSQKLKPKISQRGEVPAVTIWPAPPNIECVTTRAALLDREADHLLHLGYTRRAESLAQQAFALRGQP